MGLYRVNGKENGNYYNAFLGGPLKSRPRLSTLEKVWAVPFSGCCACKKLESEPTPAGASLFSLRSTSHRMETCTAAGGRLSRKLKAEDAELRQAREARSAVEFGRRISRKQRALSKSCRLDSWGDGIMKSEL